MTTTPQSLTATSHVSAGGKTASKGALRVGRGCGLFASTAEPADLELILESGGRVRLGGYLLVPAAPPTSNGLVFRCNSNGSGYWDSGAGLPVSWASVTGKPTTLGGFGITDAVPAARLVSAGSGLTGGGALSGDISFAVSVIDDTQHGTRGGGTTHAEATGSVAGFMPAAAVAKLAGIADGANVVGAASSTDNALARFDGTTGKLLQNSVATLDDSGNLVLGAYAAFGTNPASDGVVRLPNSAGVKARNADNSADVTLVHLTSGNLVYLGDGAFSTRVYGSQVVIYTGTTNRFAANATGIGFFGATPVGKPEVTGSRGGNAALADLLTELANLGLITNSTTA